MSADSVFGLMDTIINAGFDFVVVDESHVFKSPVARRTLALYTVIQMLRDKALEKYGHSCRVIAMTGTASGQGSIDLAGQAMILGIGDMPMEWYDEGFKEKFCTQEGFGWDDNPEKYEELVEFMQPAFAPKIRTIVEQMPRQDTYYVECPMSVEQQATYDSMKKTMSTTFVNELGQTVTKQINNALILGNQLIQIASGFIYDGEDRETAHYINSDEDIDSKSAALIQILGTATSGCVVAGKHTAAIRRAYQMVSEHCPNVEARLFDKTLTASAKKQTIRWFNTPRTDGKIPVLLSQYVRVSESLNLQTGGTSIFLSAVYKMNPAIQFPHRVRRISNKKEFVNLVLLYSCELERRQYSRMMRKFEAMISLQSDLVDAGTGQFHLPALLGSDSNTIADDVKEELALMQTESP
jgi:hypothetical protein